MMNQQFSVYTTERLNSQIRLDRSCALLDISSRNNVLFLQYLPSEDRN